MMDRRLKLISALALVALPLSLQAATGVVSTQTANQQKLQDILNTLRYGRNNGPVIGPIGGLSQAPVVATAPTVPAPTVAAAEPVKCVPASAYSAPTIPVAPVAALHAT